MKKLTLMIAVLLAGCGGSGSVSLPGPVPEPMADAFFAQVKKMVAAMPEETEASAIDGLAATAPEDSDSAAL